LRIEVFSGVESAEVASTAEVAEVPQGTQRVNFESLVSNPEIPIRLLCDLRASSATSAVKSPGFRRFGRRPGKQRI
jgi:hypothetical protein